MPALSSCGIFADYALRQEAYDGQFGEGSTPPQATQARSFDSANGRTNQQIADAYWDYATLAAEVYATKGASDTMRVLTRTWHEEEKSTGSTQAGGPSITEAAIKASDKIQPAPSTAADILKIYEDSEPDDTDTLQLKKICRINKSLAKQPEIVQLRCAALLQEDFREFIEKTVNGKRKTQDSLQANDQNGGLLQTTPASDAQDAQAKERHKAKISKFLQTIDDRDKAVNSSHGIAPSMEHCTVSKANPEPILPIEELKTAQWRRLEAIEKYEQSAAWKIFVPELAIDVWYRKREDRKANGVEAYEYALVYRGTTGWGGWTSNLQVISTITPLVWDQYRQAVEATRKIVRQIQYSQSMRDGGNFASTEILITAVGHSLGAGLAEYVYYRIPQITKVVGFNPTPVDGAHTLLGIEERQAVMALKEGNPAIDRNIWPDNPAKDSSIFLLTEKGDILGKISPCVSGPLWGSEGGPSLTCERVNLSRGSSFRQHDMRQLACKLAHIHFKGENPPKDGMTASVSN